MAEARRPSAEELKLNYSDAKVVSHGLITAWKKMPAQLAPVALMVADDSPDIMDALLPGPSPGNERKGLVKARVEVSLTKCCSSKSVCVVPTCIHQFSRKPKVAALL